MKDNEELMSEMSDGALLQALQTTKSAIRSVEHVDGLMPANEGGDNSEPGGIVSSVRMELFDLENELEYWARDRGLL